MSPCFSLAKLDEDVDAYWPAKCHQPLGLRTYIITAFLWPPGLALDAFRLADCQLNSGSQNLWDIHITLTLAWASLKYSTVAGKVSYELWGAELRASSHPIGQPADAGCLLVGKVSHDFWGAGFAGYSLQRADPLPWARTCQSQVTSQTFLSAILFIFHHLSSLYSLFIYHHIFCPYTFWWGDMTICYLYLFLPAVSTYCTAFIFAFKIWSFLMYNCMCTIYHRNTLQKMILSISRNSFFYNFLTESFCILF
jgi:hypothetical protein